MTNTNLDDLNIGIIFFPICLVGLTRFALFSEFLLYFTEAV